MESTERFTKADFEKALGQAVRAVVDETGYNAKIGRKAIQGEWQYHIKIEGTNKRICVRSSIPSTGEIASGTGQNSIRLWGQYFWKAKGEWRSFAKKDRWTTRVPGWETRVALKTKLIFLELLDDSGLAVPNPKTIEAQGSEAEREDQPTQPNKEKSGGMAREFSHSEPGAKGFTIALGDERAELETDTTKEATVKTLPLITLGDKRAEIEEDDGDDKGILPKTEPNPFQQEAISFDLDEAVRVLAPPGSGKTYVIERRVAHLLDSGIDPRHIFAVTHTKSMAEEAYARIKRLNPSIAGSALEQQICTIHALCFRILRKEGDSRRRAETWRVSRTIKDKAKELWPTVEQRPGWKEIYSWICAPKHQGMAVGEDARFYVERLGSYHGTRLEEMRRHFDGTMRRENTLTFADMLLDCELLLRDNKEARERWQGRVQYMIVDEGQDTSGQAMRVLAELAKPQDNFFVVGDADQMMFRFAGATPEGNLFAGFERRYTDGGMIQLGVNYRSTRTIVEAQMRLIAYNYDAHGGPYQGKYLKVVEPRPDAPVGEPITWDEHEGPQDEANAVVANIVESLANGGKPGDIFVGARTRAQLGYLEGPLVKAGVPYINATGDSFWTLHHIQKAVNYLRLAFDESDSKAFKKVYNIASKWNVHPWGEDKGEYCGHRYLGRAFLGAVNEDYRKAKAAHFGGGRGLRRSFVPGIADLVGFVQDLQAEMAAGHTVGAPLDMIVEDCLKDHIRYDEGIVNDEDAGAFDDFETLLEVAGQFSSVEDFLKYVDEAVRQAEAVKDKEWDAFVVISTVHRLKGLERDVVYGIGLSEGCAKRTGEPRGLLPHTFSLVAPPDEGILPTSGKGRIEDERCVAFVLVSRAKTRVHLSGVRSYRGAEMWASRFVGELGILDEYGQKEEV
jgi:superfamily I DNA/RNA helicase